MKKNWLLRIALVVLVLTLGTACLVSGTFAKYTTTVSGGDSARVAKWVFGAKTDGVAYGAASDQLIGIFETINLQDLGGEGEEDDKYFLKPNSNLIAPEAYGDFDIVIDMTGSEVAVELTSTVTLSNTAGVNLKFYIGITPLVIDEEHPIDAENYNITSAGLKAALEAAINGDVTQGATMVKTVYVAWMWVSSAGDTALGVGNIEDLPTVTLTISITATQKVVLADD